MSDSVIVTIQIINTRGLHARAAAKLVKLVESFSADIKVSKDDMSVIGESIMGLLMLGAGKGTSITVEATGQDAAHAIKEIESLIQNKFGEDH